MSIIWQVITLCLLCTSCIDNNCRSFILRIKFNRSTTSQRWERGPFPIVCYESFYYGKTRWLTNVEKINLHACFSLHYIEEVGFDKETDYLLKRIEYRYQSTNRAVYSKYRWHVTVSHALVWIVPAVCLGKAGSFTIYWSNFAQDSDHFRVPIFGVNMQIAGMCMV